jgi:hypothetical protein
MDDDAMIKSMPYGVSDFGDLVTQGFAYVDKTKFIQNIEMSPNIIAFFRPRKFGKSLFASILEYYYDYKWAHKFEDFFGNTFIGSNPTPSKNSYAILKFDFSAINTTSPNLVLEEFRDRIISSIELFRERYDIAPFRPIEYNKSPATIMDQFFTYLATKMELPIYILIDEYDQYANNMLGTQTESFKAIVSAGGFVRTFFEAIKKGKGNNRFKKLFMTGVCPITLDSLTSGFNIARNLTRRASLHDMMGFTRDEVKRLITDSLSEMDIDKSSVLEDMTALYNGYLFSSSAQNKLYNSDMVLHYLDEYMIEGKPPEILMDDNVMSDYSKLKSLASLNLGVFADASHSEIQAEKEARSKSLVSIIAGSPQSVNLTRVFELRKFDQNDFLSLLFYMGFLTIEPSDSDAKFTNLVLPNEIMKEIFYDYFENTILSPTLGYDFIDHEEAMKQMAFEGKNEKFVNCLSSFLGESPDRVYLHFAEIHFQFLGYLIAKKYSGYKTDMEKDVGYGHVDLIFGPGSIPVNYYWFIELKYIKASELNPKGTKPEDMEAVRMKKIKERWDEGLAELRKYALNPDYKQLRAEGRIKNQIVIFCTHRCLVNQEIDVHAKEVSMILNDVDWWF